MKFLNTVTSTSTISASGGLVTITSAGAPTASLSDGGLAVDTTNHQLYFRSGSLWRQVSGSGGGNAFGTVSVSGQSDVVADQSNDTLTLTGSGITITTNATTDTVTLTLAAFTGDATTTAGSTAITLATVNTSPGVPGAFGDSVTIPTVTVNAKGLVTAVTTSTVRSASTTQTGIVQLSDSTSTTSSTLAATPTAVKSAYDLANAALARSGGTMTGTITLRAGTATAGTAPLYLASGTNLTAAAAGAVEFDGTNLYFTPSTTRKTVAFTDSNITGTAAAWTTARTVTFGGTTDATGSFSISGSADVSNVGLTLATVNTTTGSFGSATAIPVITVNGKGLVTNVTTATPSVAISTGVTGLGTGVATFLATPSSANLISAVTDETGTGSLVFSTSPTLTTPNLGTPSALTLTNATGLPVSGITASTTTALGVGSIELGHASDTTIARASAGVVTIEGVNVVTTSSTDTLTNKTLTTPTIDNIKMGYTTTATAAGSTTLTNASNYQQVFTGTTTQTVVLPVASTMTLGQGFLIINNSTGALTVNSSGGNLVATVNGGHSATVICILTSGTTAASWDANTTGASAITGTGSLVFATSPTLTTPTLGVATATSLNGLTVTSSTGTLTITNAKTLSVSNTLTLAGTDSTTMTFPSTSQTIAGLAVSSQVFTTAQTFRAANAIRSEAASAQDAVVIAGRAGGTGSFAVTITPTTLAANRTLTLADGNTTLQAGTMAVTGTGLSQFAATTSAELAGVISDETGSGALVFGTSPTITTSLVAGSATFALVNTTATTLNFAGAATTLSIGAATGNTTVNNNLIVTGNLTVNGTTITVNSTTMTVDDPIVTLGGDTAPTADDNKDRGIEFRWHNGTAARVGFFGFDDSTGKFTFIPDATNTSEVFSGTLGTIDIGAVHINGSQIAASNLSNGTTGTAGTAIVLATSPTISTSLVAGTASFDLLNATATTVNFAGAATTLAIGAASGTLTIGNATITGTNATALNLNGASPSIATTSTGTASVFNTNALTGNLFGAATTISVGAATGTTTVNNTLRGAQNVVTGYTTTATAAGTTTLTVTSTRQQYFTGTTTQTVQLPVVTTLVNGWQYDIHNNSTGLLTVNTSGGNTLATVDGGASIMVTCVDTAGGTGTASWDFTRHELETMAFSTPGTLGTGTGKARFYFNRTATIRNISASCGGTVAGTTGDAHVIVDVNKNGTTMFGSKTSTSITFATTTATATVTAHGYSTGDIITVTGASPTTYNGNFSITSTGANTFTYTMATTPASNATVQGTFRKQVAVGSSQLSRTNIPDQNTTIAAGDYITVDIDDVPATSSSDLVVQVEWS